MSRTIKFRVWGGATMVTNQDDIGTYLLDWSEDRFKARGAMGKELPLMQFTGLYDSNNVEIYEGDIVKIEAPFYDGVSQITYGNGEKNDYPAFNLDYGKLDEDINMLQYGVIEGQITVIGNIYENPELLKPSY